VSNTIFKNKPNPERGIRVNAVSAGPIKTLAASGIKDFGRLLEYAANI
jgi:enoyl-[acyl-carrier protein] reductase I